MAKVGILGAGSWGTALSLLLYKNGHDVTVWSIDKKEVEMLQTEREHKSKLPGVKLPEDMVFTNNLEESMKEMVLAQVSQIKAMNLLAGQEGVSLTSEEEKKAEDFVISDTGVSEHKYVIASCCNPIPGDNVIGFKASDGTVTVHKRSCEVANNLASKFGDKLVVPKWEHAKSQNLSFLVRLSLRGFDRIGIINDITRYISFVMSVNIRKFCLGTEDGVFDGFIDLYVNDMSDLDKLMKKLQKIEGIQSVIRTDL